MIRNQLKVESTSEENHSGYRTLPAIAGRPATVRISGTKGTSATAGMPATAGKQAPTVTHATAVTPATSRKNSIQFNKLLFGVFTGNVWVHQ
jgi:hypothetical protein